MYDPIENREDFVLSLQPFFELQILVPERVSKEIQTDTAGSSLKEPIDGMSAAMNNMI